MTLAKAINNALHEIMKEDEKVIVLGEDVGIDGGVFRITEGLYERFGAKRVMDTPLSEAGIIGFSIGMAIAGLKPVPEIQFDGFIYPAFNQLVNHAARIRNRTRSEFHCQMTLRVPYGGGIRALEHHAESMEAIYGHIQGLKVVIPSNPFDAKGLLVASIRDEDPVIFFEPKRLYYLVKEEVPLGLYEEQIGKARIIQEGNDLTLISYGSMMFDSMLAVKELEKYSIEVIDLRTIKPIDEETLIKSVAKTGKCIIVHEGPRTFGVAAETIARINDHVFYSLEKPIQRVTGFDVPFPLPLHERYYLPNKERIIDAIEKIMEK